MNIPVRLPTPLFGRLDRLQQGAVINDAGAAIPVRLLVPTRTGSVGHTRPGDTARVAGASTRTCSARRFPEPVAQPGAREGPDVPSPHGACVVCVFHCRHAGSLSSVILQF